MQINHVDTIVNNNEEPINKIARLIKCYYSDSFQGEGDFANRITVDKNKKWMNGWNAWWTETEYTAERLATIKVEQPQLGSLHVVIEYNGVEYKEWWMDFAKKLEEFGITSVELKLVNSQTQFVNQFKMAYWAY